MRSIVSGVSGAVRRSGEYFKRFCTACVLLVILLPEASAKVKPAIPDPKLMTILVRTAVIALDHANRSGNYTVLRDLAAPAFRNNNSSARLAGIFRKLRARKLNLGPVVMFRPQLTLKPAVDKRGVLRLKGFFATLPQSVYFDLLFQPVNGNWRLFGLAVEVQKPVAKPKTSSPTQGAATSALAPQKPKSGKAKTKKPGSDKRSKLNPPPSPGLKIATINTASEEAPVTSVTTSKTTETRAVIRLDEPVPLPVRNVRQGLDGKQKQGGDKQSGLAQAVFEKHNGTTNSLPGKWIPWE